MSADQTAISAAATKLQHLRAALNQVLFGQEKLVDSVITGLLSRGHLLLEGLVDSYTLFKPTDPLPVGDFSDAVARLIASSFRVGVQIAMPFIVLSLLFTFALGLISRLMPTLQIFFVSVPLQLGGGMLIVVLAMSAMMTLFLTYFQETLLGLMSVR